MLQVTNLSKTYPTPRGALPVLTDVSFTAHPGELTAIIGGMNIGSIHAEGQSSPHCA